MCHEMNPSGAVSSKECLCFLAKTKWNQIENFGPQMQPPYSAHTSHQEKAA
jgi:hypothetical protein